MRAWGCGQSLLWKKFHNSPAHAGVGLTRGREKVRIEPLSRPCGRGADADEGVRLTGLKAGDIGMVDAFTACS